MLSSKGSLDTWISSGVSTFQHAAFTAHTRDQRPTGSHTSAKTPRLLGLVGKNLLGIVLILAGVAMLVLPGQGILMILIGLMLMDVPGKRALERRLVQQPSVWQAMNWIRAKAHQPALEMPAFSPPSSGREEA
jgi:hypothetical protein